MIRYSAFSTLFGWMGVVEGEKGIKKIFLPYANRTMVKKIIAREFPEAIEDDASLKFPAQTLVRYFEGNRVGKNFLIDQSGYSEFLVNVWKATRTIPWGEVRTYTWVSAQLKRLHASRAVGSALGKNPFPIIVPCHRVVRSDGRLGGFSAPGGISLKKNLLEIEGVGFDEKGRVLVKE